MHLSNSLHNTMLKRVAHAPMLFFNSNPMGRIINRFSKDTAMADSVVTFQVIQWLQVSSSEIIDVLCVLNLHCSQCCSLPLSATCFCA